MPRATWVQTNFNAGEWSPLAYGRVDVAKYRNALATCLNYIPTMQGGLTRRPGSRFVTEVKDSSQPVRLVRFEFSTIQAYMLEFGPNYIRFNVNDGQLQTGTVTAWNSATAYTVGQLAALGGVNYYCKVANTNQTPPNTNFWAPLTGTILEVPTPYAAADLFQLNFAQSADTLYIAHQKYPPMKLQRFAAVTWQLNEIDFIDGPYLIVNTTPTTLTPTGTTGTVTVTASSQQGINGNAGFGAGDIGRSLRIKCGGVWLWGTIVAVADTRHCSWQIAPANGQLVPHTATALANVSSGSIFSCAVTDGGSGYGNQPPSVTFSSTTGTAAVAYASLTNGVVTSITMSITGTSYPGGGATTVAMSAPTAIVPSTTTFWRLGVWTNALGYPGAVTFNQDRLMWAGSTQNPNRMDGSNTSDYENMMPTNLDGTVVDSNALSFTLNASTVNTIYWMVSDEWGLLVGTAGGEWVVAPSSQQTAMTPTNITAKQTTSYGCAQVTPKRIGKSVLFVQRTTRKLREMAYQWTVNTFIAPDISQLGEHLTKSGLKQLAVQLAPQQILWMVRNDGGLTAMTYDKDQEICGWHQHPMGGFSDAAQTQPALVESVECIPAPAINRDEVWILVNRYINGANHRYIEVLTKFWEDGDDLSRGVFVDSSAQYDGAPTTTISGLTWLRGQTVNVLADGAVHKPCVVDSSGGIVLDYAVKVAQVGLGYNSDGRTMRIEAGGADGPAQGKLKRIHRAVFRFFQSIGLTVQANWDSAPAYPEPWRTSADLMDNPVALFTGDKRWAWEGTYEIEGQVFWRQDDPLPSNVLLVMAQLETQDGG